MTTILPDADIAQQLQQLNVAWTAIGNDYLVRTFAVQNFVAGVELVNKIAQVAEACQHHPEVSLAYSRVEVQVSTHSVAGITQKDFEFAAQLDKVSA
jgi:4a-hydroxytetrahydrobiopterin dehydratase